eukprot:12019044-Alexandrium_andersonii.AAC.1
MACDPYIVAQIARSLHARAIAPCALSSPLIACASSTVARIWSIGSRVWPLSSSRVALWPAS